MRAQQHVHMHTIPKPLAGDLLTCVCVGSINSAVKSSDSARTTPRRRGSFCKWRPPATAHPTLSTPGNGHRRTAAGCAAQSRGRAPTARGDSPGTAYGRAVALRADLGRVGGLARHSCIKAEDVLTMHQSSDADLQEPRRTSQSGIQRPVTWCLGVQVDQLRRTLNATVRIGV